MPPGALEIYLDFTPTRHVSDTEFLDKICSYRSNPRWSYIIFLCVNAKDQEALEDLGAKRNTKSALLIGLTSAKTKPSDRVSSSFNGQILTFVS